MVINLFSWLKKKKKFNKISHQDVSDAMIALKEKEEKIENQILADKNEIDKLMELGKKEKDHKLRVLYARKVQFLDENINSNYKRVEYVLYNMKLLNKLKIAIEDNEFLNSVEGVELNQLLQDQKGLATFLNKTLNRQIKDEEILTSSDAIFEEIEKDYEKNEKIHGINNDIDKILAVFEMNDNLDEHKYVNVDRKDSAENV